MSDQFRDHILDCLSAIGPVETRRFFGGTGLHAGGRFFGMLMRDALWLRPVPGLIDGQPFSYRTSKREVQVPVFRLVGEDVLDDPERLVELVRASIAVAPASGAARRSGGNG